MERPKYIIQVVKDEECNEMKSEVKYKEVTVELTDECWNKIQKENN